MALWKRTVTDPVTGKTFTKDEWAQEQEFRADYWLFVRTGRLVGMSVGPDDADLRPKVWTGYKMRMATMMVLWAQPGSGGSGEFIAMVPLLAEELTDNELRKLMASVPKDRRSDPPAPDRKVLAEKLAGLQDLPKGWDTKERHDWRVARSREGFAQMTEFRDGALEAGPENAEAQMAAEVTTEWLEDISKGLGRRCGEPDCPHCLPTPDAIPTHDESRPTFRDSNGTASEERGATRTTAGSEATRDLGAGVWRAGGMWESVRVLHDEKRDRFCFRTRSGHTYGEKVGGYGRNELATLYMKKKLSLAPERVNKLAPGEPVAIIRNAHGEHVLAHRNWKRGLAPLLADPTFHGNRLG